MGGYQVLASLEAGALAVVSFCRHERVQVLVARQLGCHTARTLLAADFYWTSAEVRVSLCHPFLCMRVGGILPDRTRPFLYLGRRVVHMHPVLGFVPCRLGLWDGVVMREGDDDLDHPVGPHCLLPV